MKRLSLLILLLLSVGVTKANLLNKFSIIDVHPTEFYLGEIDTISITIRNVGVNAAYYVTTELTPEQGAPVGVVGSNKIMVSDFSSIGLNDEFTVNYKLCVNSSATPGVYNLYLDLSWSDYIYGGSTHKTTFIIGIVIQNPPQRAKIKVLNITTIPKVLKPGCRGLIKIELKNVGSLPAKSIKAVLRTKEPFIPLVYKEKMIPIIDVNETVTVDFEFGVNWNASPVRTYYTLPLSIVYKDKFKSYVKNISIGLIVRGEPNVVIHDVVLEPTQLTPNTQGVLTVTIINAGTASAKEIKISIVGSSEIFTESYKFIGELLPGQTQTIIFGIYVSSNIDIDRYIFNIQITYKDNFGKVYSNTSLYEISVYSPQTFIPVQYVIIFIGIILLTIVIYIAVRREILRRRFK